MDINLTLANELNIKQWQVEAVVKLLAEGATVPFIARYRKEVTGSLDDTQLRNLEERLGYLNELEERRVTILNSIEQQGKLTPELKKSIEAADNKARLEDLYLPFKPKRRTKAQIAIEAGLEPLANELLADPSLEPQKQAEKYLNPEHKIDSADNALEGARYILIERFSEDADLINALRTLIFDNGIITSKVVEDKQSNAAKFADYFDFSEAVSKIPSHRMLALLRGQKEGFLRVNIELSDADSTNAIQKIANKFNVENKNRPADLWLSKTVELAFKTKIKLKLDLDIIQNNREDSEVEAINVFKQNLQNLLMAAPAGKKVVMGLDPGLRTGVKAVVVDNTGKLLEYITIFPHAPQKQWPQSLQVLADLCKKHQVELISIGNGTASRETDKLVAELIKAHSELNLTKIVVSEAGASVYSASELAAKEFPDLDVSYRGAVSIARRLQDPLAELVKIDPKSIGVGQYQHDVNQIKLSKGLNNVLEDCVNKVGADINTASIPLLKSIAGLNETVASNIVKFREENGRFTNRASIKKVPRLGDKTYEQAIGFLRIIGGENPLDASGVHPESYPVIEEILKSAQLSIETLMGNVTEIKKLNAKNFVTEQFGLPTIEDILDELKKPGRDPRPEFKMVKFVDGIETLNDLKTNMILEGTVTNVTNFGAFVDIGVHQDGLVHISQLSNKYVSDPHQVVKAGQIVKVKVLEVDIKRKRIQLSMKLQEEATQPNKRKSKAKAKAAPQTLLGDALMAALGK